jgi:PAS domain S-box-containing protein
MMRPGNDDSELERLRAENRSLRDLLRKREARQEPDTDSEQRGAAALILQPAFEMLAQQVRLFDTALSSIADFVFICDLQGRITYANRARLQFWQRELNEVLGKNFFELGYPEALAARIQAQIETVIATKQPLRAESPYQTVEGRIGYYDYILVPVLDTDGAVEAIAGSTRDISDLHREQTAQQALLRTLQVERERLSSLFLQAPAFIAVLRGPQHVFEIANPLYYRLVGQRELIGKPVREAFPEIEGQSFFEILDTVYRTAQPFLGRQMRILLQEEPEASLRERYIDFVYQPLVEADGSVSGIFVHGVDLTEQKRAEEALRASEELFRTTLHSIGDAVIATDVRGRVTFMNSVAERLTGWSASEASGKDAGEVFHIVNEETREEVVSPITRVLAENRVVGLANHTVVLSRDGSEYPIEDSGAPICNEAGDLFGVVLVFRDVTEARRKEQAVQQSQARQKQAEEHRRQVETRFRLLVEQSPLSIQILSPDGRTLQVNRAWEQLWSLKLEDLRDYNMLEDPQLAEKGILPYIRRGFAGETVTIPPILYDPEETLPNRPSQKHAQRWTQAFLYPVKDEAGQIREMVLIHEDITEQKQAEQARAHLVAIVRSSDDAIISKDLNGIITSWNPAAERIYGYRADEVLGKSKSLLIPPEMPDELPNILRKIRAGERIELYETVRVRKDGKRIHLSMSVSPVFDAGGRIAGASTIARDISERLRHLQEIEALNARLRRSLQETHHRVKNNLQVISALADIQMEHDQAMVPVAALARIGQHTRSLAAVHDLLTQEAKADGSTDSISTQATLDKLIPLLQATTGGRRITYMVEDFRLPVREGASLALLISELISNAVKHGRLDIELTLTRRGDSALLEVYDDGPGFPPDFDWREAANTGMELIDSTGRHDLHGTISYQNRPEGGAHVVVTFPVPSV